MFRYLPPLLFLCLSPPLLSPQHTHTPGLSPLSSCTSNTSSADRTQFTVAVVEDEFIVRFHGFYAAAVRATYIRHALAGTGRASYSILARDNPMAGRPSDFDVVRGALDREELEQLRAHPGVRSVSREKRITRRLLEEPVSEVEESAGTGEDDGSGGERIVKKKPLVRYRYLHDNLALIIFFDGVLPNV